MKRKKTTLGDLGEKFFSWIQLKNRELVRLGELQTILRISNKQEKELLSRLSRKGYIIRLQRGTYLVPQKLPPGGHWAPNEYTMIYELMKLLNADYQICGPLAFQKFGFNTQIPNIIAVYNTKKSGLTKIGKMTFQLIKISPTRIGSREKIKLASGKIVYVSNLERTIMDAIYDYSRFNTLPIAYNWIIKYSHDPIFIKNLVKVVCRYSNVNTMRRVGYFLDKMGIDNKMTNPILSKLNKTQGWIPLIPSYAMKGVTNKKWGIIDNGLS
ncbi:MAG: DUF6088 family protein [Candidatus Berkiellales bacterium]